MIQDREVWAAEKAYLNRVTHEISVQLDLGLHAADNYKSDAIALQKSMWEDLRIAPTSLFDLENVAQINQIQMDLRNKASLYQFSYEKVARLQRMQHSPYFGRIDFLENGTQAAEKIYIGIHHLDDRETMDILVYDWRAPVSGMFYDYEIGPSAYTCPAGLIEGRLVLKRQYKIEDGAIVYMFDSSVNINDAMLQDLLGKNTDTRMKTIVTSIQKEQNTVIRNDRDKILIVEGPAGSGKTSIALHRAAYLLYRYRDTVQSENILIFSPNHVFEDYISRVLPELGEENIRRSTFADFFGSAFFDSQQTETVNQQMEYILNAAPGDTRLSAIRFKASPLFLTALKNFVRRVEDGGRLPFKDVFYNGSLLISADGIVQLYHSQNSRLPYASRLEKLRQRLLTLLEDAEEDRRRKSAGKKEPEDKDNRQALRDEYQRLQNELTRMTIADTGPLYLDLLKNIGEYLPADAQPEAKKYRRLASCGLRELQRSFISYEDFAPIAYLHAALEAGNQAGTIQHVIIDEAQDYTPVQYELFKTVFKSCSMTILGDINQTVNGWMNIGSFDAASEVFDAAGMGRIALTKSYRSSKELADFCRGLLDSPVHTEQLDRHGAKPRLVRVGADSVYGRLTADITDLKSKGYKLIAVICKTAAQCRTVHHAIHSAVDISLISNQNEVYTGDVVVIPSYLAKGLEFDAVLVLPADDAAYHAPEDRRLLYTVCTRALHELRLYCTGPVSRFISGVDESLYEVDEVAE